MSNSDWITINPVNGNNNGVFSVSCTDNETNVEKSSTISVSSSGLFSNTMRKGVYLSNCYYTSSSQFLTLNGTRSFEFYFSKESNSGVYNNVLFVSGPANNTLAGIDVYWYNENRFVVFGPKLDIVYQSTSMTLNTKYHLVVTVNKNIVKCYLNGVLVSTKTYTDNLTYDLYRLGGTNSSDYFRGWLGYSRIYNTVLTDEEVKILYNNGDPLNYNVLISGVQVGGVNYLNPNDILIAEYMPQSVTNTNWYDSSKNSYTLTKYGLNTSFYNIGQWLNNGKYDEILPTYGVYKGQSYGNTWPMFYNTYMRYVRWAPNKTYILKLNIRADKICTRSIWIGTSNGASKFFSCSVNLNTSFQEFSFTFTTPSTIPDISGYGLFIFCGDYTGQPGYPDTTSYVEIKDVSLYETDSTVTKQSIPITVKQTPQLYGMISPVEINFTSSGGSQKIIHTTNCTGFSADKTGDVPFTFPSTYSIGETQYDWSTIGAIPDNPGKNGKFTIVFYINVPNNQTTSDKLGLMVIKDKIDGLSTNTINTIVKQSKLEYIYYTLYVSLLPINPEDGDNCRWKLSFTGFPDGIVNTTISGNATIQLSNGDIDTPYVNAVINESNSSIDLDYYKNQNDVIRLTTAKTMTASTSDAGYICNGIELA